MLLLQRYGSVESSGYAEKIKIYTNPAKKNQTKYFNFQVCETVVKLSW